MPDTKYVVVGSGMTAHAAAQGIRSKDPSGSITFLERGLRHDVQALAESAFLLTLGWQAG